MSNIQILYYNAQFGFKDCLLGNKRTKKLLLGHKNQPLYKLLPGKMR